MISIPGIYDGKKLKLSKTIKLNSPQKVIVTFLDDDLDNDIPSNKELMQLAEKSKAFKFLEKEPDLYSDKDLKVKYKK
jgi:hypothetical protein